ncbi:MAG: hypothetical protein IKU84_01160 [Clostridia bacterium]|nr:hypothetical protein [Clostridia bacterium]
MLIKTVVDEKFEGAVKFSHQEFNEETGTSVDVELWLAEIEYDNAFAENIAKEASKWHVHTKFIYDYESSTDAGDGRDDYSVEENDVEISPDDCIVKDGAFAGCMCHAFDKDDFILISNPKTCIWHPGNYSGRGYHFYRNMFFELLRK